MGKMAGKRNRLTRVSGVGESGGFAQGGANETVWQRRKCLEAHLIDTEANEHGEACIKTCPPFAYIERGESGKYHEKKQISTQPAVQITCRRGSRHLYRTPAEYLR